MKKFLIYISVLLFLFTLSCDELSQKKIEKKISIDFKEIKERGKLIALTGYNAYSYFIYRGQPMGFEYELVKQLADHLNVDLEIKVVKDIKKMVKMLNEGEGDLIAFNLTVTNKRKENIAFTKRHNTTKQVLVQRRPENWRHMRIHEIEEQLVRSPLDLEGKTIYVRNNSAYIDRIKNLNDEIGGGINIVEAGSDYSTEDLIRMVSEGEIEYTISDKNIANLNQAYFDNIDTGTDVSLEQKVAWAVRKNSPQLLALINSWIDQIRDEPRYYVLYNKYYKSRNSYRTRIQSDYFSHTGGKLSKYDGIIKELAAELNWDWRIVASLIYQESQFNPRAESWAGAVGLMQLMPATAQEFGLENPTNPKENLEAGMKYLKWLDDFWVDSIPDSLERIKFVLASYNIGLGHIVDARKLAEKYGADPNVWFDNVEFYLLQKSKKKFYTDEVVRNGYSRGTETVKYVEEIFDRYEDYKQFIT